MGSRYSKEEKGKFLVEIEEQWKSGKSLPEISLSTGLSLETLGKWTEQEGIRKKGERNQRRKRECDVKLLKTLARKGLTIEQMAERMGVSTYLIFKWKKEHGIETNIGAKRRMEQEERNQTAVKRKKKRCATCIYKGKQGVNGCDYILKTGQKRDCKPEECDKYERRKRGCKD